MDYEENYVLLENLDGTILIGTQPHIRDRKFVHCWSCKKIQSCSQSAKYIKCGSCGIVNGIPGSNEEDIDRLIMIRCNKCNNSLKTYEGVLAIKCPTCYNIIKTGQID